jgi:hypothetical protein
MWFDSYVGRFDGWKLNYHFNFQILVITNVLGIQMGNAIPLWISHFQDLSNDLKKTQFE